MGYISRRYYASPQEDAKGIWQYLDCIEKVAYHQFLDMPISMEDVFCDDVNICLLETEGDLRLKRNNIKSLDLYFDMNWEINPEKPVEYIKGMIDRGIIVGINTYFYDIPNFTWYKRERYRKSVHISMVVGYDECGFWLTDVPALMQSEYLLDQHTTTISYVDMKQYLAKQCKILTFEKIASSFPNSPKLGDLTKKIIKEYSAQPYVEKGGTVWKGKNAYERLLYLIQEGDPRLLEMDFFHGDFVSYIISGRHNLLRRNLINNYGNNSATENVLWWLNVCQKKWEILAKKILKENLKNGIYTPIEEDIYNIYESENMLMEFLRLFCDKND